MNYEKLGTLAAALPEAYKANALALVERMGQVIEGIGDNDVKWRAPLAKIIQGTSDRSKLAKGINIGDIVIGENKVEQPFKFIPLRMWSARQMWSPDQNEAKILCSSPDAKVGYKGDCNSCPHSKFDEVAKRADCGKIKQVISISADLSEIFTVNFAKTSFKIGNDFEALLKKAGVLPYRRHYSMSAKTSQQYKNVETYSIEPLGGKDRDVPAEVLDFVAQLFAEIGTERKEAVDAFHKYILERKQSGHLALESEIVSDADSVVLVESGSDVVVDVPSSMTKRYEV